MGYYVELDGQPAKILQAFHQFNLAAGPEATAAIAAPSGKAFVEALGLDSESAAGIAAAGTVASFIAGKNVPKSTKSGISTGRTVPNNLNEKLAMEEVKANPMGTTPPRMPKMSDTKNGLLHDDGWIKRTQNVNGVEIHYVENIKTKEFVDFKFKD